MATEYNDNILNWQEGHEGKGIIDRNGFVHTWTDDEFGLHRDYIEHAGLDQALAYFVIAPDGRVDPAGAEPLGVNMADIITEVDPRLYHDFDQPHDWNFSKVAMETHTPPGLSPWEEGDSGKGMVYDGKLWTWYDKTEDPWSDESIHHQEAFRNIFDDDDYYYQRAGHDFFPFWIDADGTVTTNDQTGAAWDDRVHAEVKPMIDAHPQLTWAGKHSGEWNFG